MKIVIINGPNLNLLGKREVQIYGTESFDTYLSQLKKSYPSIQLELFQSNVEGELINLLQEQAEKADGIIINPAGYSHTSVAITDAIAAIQTPVVEVHISNIHAREEFRQTTLTGKNCIGVISGLGLKGYELALNYFTKQ